MNTNITDNPEATSITAKSKKSLPDKATVQLRENILQALEEQPGGAVEYLKELAKEDPKAFISLLGRVLPSAQAGDPKRTMHHTFEWLKP